MPSRPGRDMKIILGVCIIAQLEIRCSGVVQMVIGLKAKVTQQVLQTS